MPGTGPENSDDHSERSRSRTIPEAAGPSQSQRQGPVTSTHTSESSFHFPFDSQASIEQGGVKDRNLGIRIINALHLSKSYPPGADKGRIDQIIHSLNEYPVGYGKVAGIQGLDTDFLVYRKFGWLHNYALLHLQDELAQLQDDLEILDKLEFSEGNPRRLQSRRLDYNSSEASRKELLGKVHSKLAQYDEALLRMQQIQSLKRPSKRSQRNVYNLISNTQSLVDVESEWIREGPDLAALGYGSEYSWLNTFFENILNGISRTATKAIFRGREQRIKSGDEDIQLVSLDRLDFLVRTFITVIAVVILLVPVYLLSRLQPKDPSKVQRQNNLQILTIFLFTLLLSFCCSIFTKAKKQEVFMATATYAAVLVVFLGNSSSVSSFQNGS